jgi:acetyl esterase
MPLHPQVQVFLDAMAEMGGPPLHELPVDVVRQIVIDNSAARGEPEPIDAVSDRTIRGSGGDLAVRIYRPRSSEPLPVLVFLHGGGWVAGNLDTHDGICRTLANAVPCAVVAVDYRLAPEHPFPAAVDDAEAAVEWVAANAATFGGDADRVAVGGDSAGGNLATVVARRLRDAGGPALAFQLLVYPVTDYRFDTASYRENGDGYFLTRDGMAWFWGHYLGGEAHADSPDASPLRAADLGGLPPALVITAEFDPLRDEGEAYAERLRQAGVPAVATRYDGMIHTFFGMSAVWDDARRAVEDAAAALRKAFASG